MQRRTYLRGVGTAAVTGLLAGCTGSDDSEPTPDNETDTDDNSTDDGEDETETTEQPKYGTLATSVSDQPNDIDDFASLTVTLEGIWVKPANSDSESTTESDSESETETNSTEGNETDTESSPETTDSGGNETTTDSSESGSTIEDEDAESGERKYIEFDELQDADLTELQGAESQLVDETELEVGEYEYLQLNVHGVNGRLAETQEEADVQTPGEAPLKFNQSFEIREEERTHFVADFAPHKTGEGKYVIRPVADGTAVLYGDEEYTG